VTKLIEQLREAISHYQVSECLGAACSTVDMGGQISQQQAIYDQITGLTVRRLRLTPGVVLTVVDFLSSHLSVCS